MISGTTIGVNEGDARSLGISSSGLERSKSYKDWRPPAKAQSEGNQQGIISNPNLRPFWYYSLCKPPFRLRSGELL